MREEPSASERLGRRALLSGTVAVAVGGCAPARAPDRPKPDPRTHSPDAPPTPRLARSAVPRPLRPPAGTSARASGLSLLEARFPELAPHLRPAGLVTGPPTPVVAASSLGAAVGVPRLFVKGDDRIAEPYGGGKIRKLDLFLGAALGDGRRAVVTSGAAGSHHALATAIFARRLGLDCTLLLMHGTRLRETCPTLLAERACGARLELVGGPSGVARALRRLAATAEAPYVIPVGGTSPLGNLGTIAAALELEAQVEAGEAPHPDAIVVAMGTMGTAVGLTLGLALTRLRTTVIAVRVSNVPTSTEDLFLAELAATRGWLAERGARLDDDDRDRCRIEAGYLGPGYGLATVEGARAQALAATHGLRLEPTYTAKAFAAIVGEANQLRNRTVLFWQTHSAWDPEPGSATPASLPSALRGYCYAQ